MTGDGGAEWGGGGIGRRLGWRRKRRESAGPVVRHPVELADGAAFADVPGKLGRDLRAVIDDYRDAVASAAAGTGWSGAEGLVGIMRRIDGLLSVPGLPVGAGAVLERIWVGYGGDLVRVGWAAERGVREEGRWLAVWLREMFEHRGENWCSERGLDAVLKRADELRGTGEVSAEDAGEMERAWRKYCGDCARAMCWNWKTMSDVSELNDELEAVMAKAGCHRWMRDEMSYADIPGMAAVMARIDVVLRRGGLSFEARGDLEDERRRWLRHVRLKADLDAAGADKALPERVGAADLSVAAGAAQGPVQDPGPGGPGTGEPGPEAAAGGAGGEVGWDPVPPMPSMPDRLAAMGGAAELAAGTFVVGWMLAELAEDVCRHYLPNGKRTGAYWLVGSLDGEAGDSLFVHLEGPNRGRWADSATGQRGDLFDLIQGARGLEGLMGALKEAEVFLGGRPDEQAEPVPPTPAADDKDDIPS